MRSRGIQLAFGVPTAVLAGAFVWLAVEHRTIALWNVVVHESGRYTLGQTILYFSHFLREIPTVIAMSLFVVATGALPGRARVGSSVSLMWTVAGLAGAGLLVAVSFFVAARDHGVSEALQNLNQLYTRDDLPAYGSHWRFHFLSTMWFGLASPVVAWLGTRLFGGPASAGPLSSLPGRIAWIYFALLTVVYGITTEPLLDPRFIGHQARELFTHALVTLPLGLGLVALANRSAGVDAPRAGVPRPSMAAVLAVVTIPIYLAVAMRLTDSLASGQTQGGLAAMVAAHFFEHSLDYLLAGCLVAGLANAAHLTDVVAKAFRGRAATANHVKSSARED
jgi:hypothetical protein